MLVLHGLLNTVNLHSIFCVLGTANSIVPASCFESLKALGMKSLPTELDGHFIRRVFDEAAETWWFSVIDVVQVLAQQPDCQTARKYWNKLKERLSK